MWEISHIYKHTSNNKYLVNKYKQTQNTRHRNYIPWTKEIFKKQSWLSARKHGRRKKSQRSLKETAVCCRNVFADLLRAKTTGTAHGGHLEKFNNLARAPQLICFIYSRVLFYLCVGDYQKHQNENTRNIATHPESITDFEQPEESRVFNVYSLV